MVRARGFEPRLCGSRRLCRWATRAIGAPRVIRTPTTVGLNDVSLPIGLPERGSLVALIHPPPAYQYGILPIGEASKMVLRAWNRTCGLPLTRRLLFRTELTEHGGWFGQSNIGLAPTRGPPCRLS